MELPTLLAKAIRSPRTAVRELRCLAKAWYFRCWCQASGKRFRAGRNLRLEGWIVLRGPGEVILGDNVRIGMTVTPWTYSVDARIEIGNESYVNGATFGCKELIRIGPRAILGRSSIMDTNFHSLLEDRHSPSAPVRTDPVILEENVWVAANAGILPGTRIGRNSVVGFGAVCSGTYPANVVIAGNPARVIRGIDESDSSGFRQDDPVPS